MANPAVAVGTGIAALLSSIWEGVKAWKAKRAAADLPAGEKILEAMRKDAEEIDRLSEGVVTGEVVK